jgi:hypothetical protein
MDKITNRHGGKDTINACRNADFQLIIIIKQPELATALCFGQYEVFERHIRGTPVKSTLYIPYTCLIHTSKVLLICGKMAVRDI